MRLALSQGVLISSGWEDREMAKDSGRQALWSHWVHKTSVGLVEAFDASQGKLLWSLPNPAQEVLVADGAAYFLVQSGNPATEQQLVGVDLKTGQQRWRLPPAQFAADPDLHLNYAGQGVLVLARTKSKAITVLSGQAGKTLWEIQPAGQFWTPVVDGLLWYGNTCGSCPWQRARGTGSRACPCRSPTTVSP